MRNPREILLTQNTADVCKNGKLDKVPARRAYHMLVTQNLILWNTPKRIWMCREQYVRSSAFQRAWTNEHAGRSRQYRTKPSQAP